METTMSFAEMVLIISGLLFITKSVMQYGKRTSDWGGVAKMFYKRVGMDTAEYKWYRLGVSCFIVGVVVRIVNLTFWPV
ncbi:hypothetical protein [Photobacterium sp. OFAV2-7]|uniref:hypothetical protein n=1 Tax=Photobacterium sp. OFAV2-7 TaxID=2917748 RepID=UPI001EF5B692|nr:hypothetical protein [Photobacterium sp. OFAV2-7]MCG7587017.1 hypothetical protein [Photobacterium sp. OFAV2-7]